MCGIVGIWNFNSVDISDETLERFTDSLAHRGPDGRGVFRDRGTRLSLGHRRLAILDLSPTGHQPMSYANGRYWITYNGEVYNFLELRQELEGLGYKFVSESDTEVILAAYAQWGEECQLKFNGMWAFAIWDRQDRVLFLSRDRFGIKPLHYIATDQYFAFASEMKSFLALSCYDYGFDYDVLTEVLSNMNGLEGTELCLLRGVKHLIGGHCLTVRAGQPPQVRRWWDTLNHLQSVPRRFEEQAEKFRELFFDACRIRMRSDVPLGTSLSGGLDSSAVLCTIHAVGQSNRFTSDWQKAFVACFPDTYLDEQQYARQVIEAKKAVAVYTEISVEDCLSDIEEIVYQFEDVYFVLLAGLWLNYKSIRDNRVVVSLDGHGADELLGGYHFIVEEEMRNALFPFPKIGRYFDLKKTMRGFAGGSNKIDTSFRRDLHLLISECKRKLLSSPIGQPVRRIYRRIRGKSGCQNHLFVDQLKERKLNWQAELVKRDELIGLSNLNRNLFVYFHDTVLPTILRNFDRASMAHGIEVRMPFMDWRLVCFGFSLPDESKIGDGYAKRILRESIRNVVPDSIRLRTNKIGFTSPMAQWFKGPLHSFLLDTVNSGDFLASNIWNGRLLREFVETSVRNQDWLSLEIVWPYVNTHILLKQFDRHRSGGYRPEVKH